MRLKIKDCPWFKGKTPKNCGYFMGGLLCSVKVIAEGEELRKCLGVEAEK